MKNAMKRKGNSKKTKRLIKKIELKSEKPGLYLCGGGNYCNEPHK